MAFMHWCTLLWTGNQLIDSNSWLDIWRLLSNFRQNQTHLSCPISIFFLSFSLRLGYHAEQALSKCDWIIALHSILHSVGVRNLFLLQRNFSFPLILLNAFKAIGSPDKVSPKTKPRYVICKCVLFLYFYILHLVFLHF